MSATTELRDMLDAYGIEVTMHRPMTRTELARENAKLRELLADLAICACGKYCYGCPHQYDGCDRDQRLHELGIEVDE